MRKCGCVQVWVSPVRPRVIEALLSFTRLEAVRLEAYSSLETACCFSALKHLPALTHLDLRLSGSHYALADNVDALHSLAKCLRLVRPRSCPWHAVLIHHQNIPVLVACLETIRPIEPTCAASPSLSLDEYALESSGSSRSSVSSRGRL